jgi:hypothetical protein
LSGGWEQKNDSENKDSDDNKLIPESIKNTVKIIRFQ